jgi:hypothetical protein
MLHYATTLQPDLSFLLMERRPKSLEKMFNDAQEIQHSKIVDVAKVRGYIFKNMRENMNKKRLIGMLNIESIIS